MPAQARQDPDASLLLQQADVSFVMAKHTQQRDADQKAAKLGNPLILNRHRIRVPAKSVSFSTHDKSIRAIYDTGMNTPIRLRPGIAALAVALCLGGVWHLAGRAAESGLAQDRQISAQSRVMALMAELDKQRAVTAILSDDALILQGLQRHTGTDRRHVPQAGSAARRKRRRGDLCAGSGGQGNCRLELG
ncbi:hypothetical protein ACFSHQ_10330 [Gemmobacter lanyuensis]